MKRIIDQNPVSAFIEYNAHKNVYETVENYYDRDDFASEEEYQECIKTDTVYRVQVYPKTPVGFYSICTNDLESAIIAMENALKEGE